MSAQPTLGTAAVRIAVEAGDWSGHRRAFTARGHGLSGSAAVEVSDEVLRIEVAVPWVVGMLAPAVEAVGRPYAGRLLTDEGARV